MTYPTELTHEMLDALILNGFEFEYFQNRCEFLLINEVGSFIQNDFPIVLLFAQNFIDAELPLVEVDIQDEEETEVVSYPDNLVAQHFGYSIVCESPLEIEGKNGQFIALECGLFLMSHLRSEYRKFKAIQ